MNYDLSQYETFVFDCDGTLLPEGQMDMSPSVYDMIGWLCRHGKKIVIASGRQLYNLVELFKPVKNCDIYYIGENGNIASYKGELLDYVEMPREDALAIAKTIIEKPHSEAVISGLSKIYFWQQKGREHTPLAAEVEIFDYKIIHDLSEIQEPILKVSFFHPDGVGVDRTNYLRDLYGDPYHGAISGFYWQDFTLGNKGLMLEHLSQKIGFDPKTTVVFGDNWNDLQMLEWASLSFIKEDSDPDLLRFADGKVADVPSFVWEHLDPANKDKAPFPRS